MPASKLIAARPSPGSPMLWEFPSFTRTRLDSGFQVLLAHTPGRALASAQLLFEAGASYETSEEGGAAAITAQALIEGTNSHKGPRFIQALEGYGAEITSDASWDSFRLAVSAPVSRLEPVLELVAEAVREPELAWREVDRLTQTRVGDILGQYAGAGSRANIAFNKLIYTADSPYSRPAGGSYWSVATMGKKTVKKFYQRMVNPRSATLILVGDLEGFPAEKVIDKVFGGWKSKNAPPPRPHLALGDNLRHITALLVERPDSEQSHIQMGHVGLPRSTPDYFPVLAVSAVLGGPFDSRLNMKLREEKGYTYGIQAGFNFRRQAGPFAVNTAVDTDVTADAIRDAVDVIRKIHEKGITKKELEQVKGYLTGIFTLRFETPDAIASALADLVIYDLPDDFYDNYRANVEKVTLDDANRVASEHLRPDRLGVVVVGDAEKVKEPLFAAELGTVAVIEDPEPGNPPTH